MSDEDARELLRKCLVNPDLVNNKQGTSTLLAQLTYLPLAIIHAAAYISENGISLSEYVSLLSDQEADVIGIPSEEFETGGDERYVNLKDPIGITWSISFEQIRQRDSLAADCLSFMACIDPNEVPLSLLPAGPSRKRQTEAIGTLDAYSFISRSAEAFNSHRLVHIATRNWLRKEQILVE